jgi:hypothetical protein
LAVLALAVSAPLRQRRQLGDYMGEAMGNYGMQNLKPFHFNLLDLITKSFYVADV